MNKIWVGCVLTSLFTPLANAQAPLSLEERGDAANLLI